MSDRYSNHRGWGDHHGRGRGSYRGNNRGRGRGAWQQSTHSSGHHGSERDNERWNQRGHPPGQHLRGHSPGQYQTGHPPAQHQQGSLRQEDEFHGDQRSRSQEFGPSNSPMNHAQPHREMTLSQNGSGSHSFQHGPPVRPPFPRQMTPMQHRPPGQQFDPNLPPPMPRFPGADMHQTGPSPHIFTEQAPMQPHFQDGHDNVQSMPGNMQHTNAPQEFHNHPRPPMVTPSGNLPNTNVLPPHHLHLQEFHDDSGPASRMVAPSMPPGNVPYFNIPPPPHDSGFAPPPSKPDEEPAVVKTDQMVDKRWVDRFVAGIRLPGTERSEILMPIQEGKRILREYLMLLKQLETCRAVLASCLDADDATWRHQCNQAHQIKVKLSGMQQNLEATSFVPRLMQKIAKIKKRRESIARRKKRAFLVQEAKKERIRRVTEKMDADLAKEQKAIEDAKNEAALQKEADSTLFEVRSKKKDADKILEILRALRKLRNVRKEAAAQKGSYTEPDSDKRFEGGIQRLEQLMNKARTTYRDEEQTLLVMLEEEHEENKEKQMEILRQRQKESALRSVQKRKEALFGKDEIVGPEDPMFSFQQFYTLAEHNLHALVEVRRQWDQFLVPPDDPQGSGIPVDWVLPSEPSSKAWASALEDT